MINLQLAAEEKLVVAGIATKESAEEVLKGLESFELCKTELDKYLFISTIPKGASFELTKPNEISSTMGAIVTLQTGYFSSLLFFKIILAITSGNTLNSKRIYRDGLLLGHNKDTQATLWLSLETQQIQLVIQGANNDWVASYILSLIDGLVRGSTGETGLIVNYVCPKCLLDFLLKTTSKGYLPLTGMCTITDFRCAKGHSITIDEYKNGSSNRVIDRELGYVFSC